MSDPIVGIDLGTSNTVVAFADEAGVVKVLADEAGYKIHPSVVSFHPSGGVVVGAAAKQRKVIDPANTIYSAKRLIGRSFRAPEVQTAKARMPYKITEGANQLPMITTRGGEFAVPEISAIVLDHVRNVAAEQIGREVNRAVVTVPASFNDAQRSATATAGAIAGLTIVRVLNEPTAAALAYGHARDLRQIIAVYDFGGGTFDITILKLEDQVYEVLGTAGDTFLGGDDLDERLVDRMVAKFLSENRIDLRTNEVAMMRLRAVAEQTKIELSRRSRAVVRIDEIAYGKGGAPLNLQIEVTRDEFVSQIADVIDRTFPVVQDALSLARLGIDGIDDIILVGGTTKIPYVRDQVAKFFAKSPRTDVNPEDAVAVGAALQGMSLERILNKAAPKSAPVPVQDFRDFDTTTSSGLLAADSSITAATMVSDEATHAALTEQTLEQAPPRPKRPTSGYSERGTSPDALPLDAMAAAAAAAIETKPKRGSAEMRPTERPAARGASVDRFEPSITPVPLARITKPGTPAHGGPTAPARTAFGIPPGPPATIPGPPPVPATMPMIDRESSTEIMLESEVATMPAVPSPALLAGNAPSPHRRTSPAGAAPPPPQRQTLAMPPVQRQTVPLRPLSQPQGVAPPPSPPQSAALPPQAKQPQMWPTNIPTGPAAPPTAQTLFADLPVTAQRVEADSPASTHRGMIAPQAPTLNDLGPLLELDEPAAASTARGFAPPTATTQQQAVSPAQLAQLAAMAAVTQVAQPPPVARAPVVLDVTPRGLGIGTVAGYCEELIRRNSRLPTEMRKLFTTSRDSQNQVRIVVCQGESKRLDNNIVIGDLLLADLPPRPRGETSIEVTFHLDASGILQVRARDAQTGREQRVSLDVIGSVPQQDVAASRDRIQQLRVGVE